MTAAAARRSHLIVTADDFGLDESVNAAVETAHRCGILTAASLMVNGPAAEDAVRRARALPTLQIGLHLVLVEGRPMLARKKIPDLVDETGQLRTGLARLSVDLACRPNIRAQLRAEIAAQFDAFRQTGLALDHVNAHKHFHLHPCVADDVIAIGRAFGMKALRVPAEPSRVLARLEAGASAIPSVLLQPWIALLRRRALQAGLLVPDHVFGRAWSGRFTARRLAKLLDNLPEGLTEIYLHPGLEDEFPGHAEGYRYRSEFEALRAQAVIDAAGRRGCRRGSYANAT